MKITTHQITRVVVLVSAFIVLVIILKLSDWQPQHSNRISTCYLNLRQIEIAKHDWAVCENMSSTNVPTWADLRPYLQGLYSNGIPVCPSGGTYKLGRVDEDSTCSIGGPRHSIPIVEGSPISVNGSVFTNDIKQ